MPECQGWYKAVAEPLPSVLDFLKWAGEPSQDQAPAYWESYELLGLPWWLSDKQFTSQCRRFGFHPRVGKISWRRKYPQYSCLGRPIDRGARWAPVHGATKELNMTQQLNSRLAGTGSSPGHLASPLCWARDLGLFFTNWGAAAPTPHPVSAQNSSYVCSLVTILWEPHVLLALIQQEVCKLLLFSRKEERKGRHLRQLCHSLTPETTVPLPYGPVCSETNMAKLLLPRGSPI